MRRRPQPWWTVIVAVGMLIVIATLEYLTTGWPLPLIIVTLMVWPTVWVALEQRRSGGQR